MRRLTLHRETLGDLTADELAGVAGGGATPLCVTRLAACPTDQVSLCHLCDLLSRFLCD